MVILFLFYLIRIVIFVKMRDSVGREYALNAMLVCAGHIFTSHGECYLTIRLRARVFYEQIVNEAQPS